MALGGVCGIYGLTDATATKKIAQFLRSEDYKGRVVPHANGLLKLEINQINSLLNSMTES
jgi:hypothetical protein